MALEDQDQEQPKQQQKDKRERPRTQPPVAQEIEKPPQEEPPIEPSCTPWINAWMMLASVGQGTMTLGAARTRLRDEINSLTDEDREEWSKTGRAVAERIGQVAQAFQQAFQEELAALAVR